MIVEVPPFAWYVVGAVLVAVVRGPLLKPVLLAIPILSGINVLGLEEGFVWQWHFLDYTLTPVRVDPLSLLFGYLFHIAALFSFIFALHVKDRIQHVAAMLYVAGGVGAVFSGDLVSLFLTWEVMAVASAFLILARRTPLALAAGLRYLAFQVMSGVLLLAGALIRIHDTGSIDFDFIGLDGVGSWLIFMAFGIKCAFPLLHNWLTDAYPEATPTGTVFLSAFTTKVAVYALARGFPGTEILVYIGAVMTCFPIFYAVIENDLRRVLAYSMVNQLGFMVCGIGIGTGLAINGAVAHAFNDVIFKGLLMMTMGAVLHQTGRINGSDLGGLYKSMPATAGFCVVGAASISAFPLFSGFVSKSMVMVAALDQGYHWVWLGLLFASAGVFHHAGIKIPFFAFFSHDSGIRTREAPWNMLLAMALASALCIFNGSYPWVLYDLLPFGLAYSPFDATHIIAQLQLLFFSALAFVWLKLSGLYPPELRSVNIDAEWVYRRLVPKVAIGVVRGGSPLRLRLSRRVLDSAGALGLGLQRHCGPVSVAMRSGSTARMVLWAAALLGGYLVFYYA